MTADLLLLNATNLPWRPIFPYAFVQVSALARRAGLEVEVLDLLNVPKDRWESLLSATVARLQPRMVGLHVRQGDSVFLDDYYAPPSGPATTRNYFPIEDNRELVRVLRRVTRAPVIAGGFGFTTHAHRLFDYLEVDYGAQGCPDDVITHFEDLAACRNLSGIKSLVHREGGRACFNERGFFGPFSEREYTDKIVDALVRFYGHSQLYGADPPTVPVEVMRGCPFRCFFCTEPHVKGRALRYRDLDVVEAELEFLVHRQLRRFWLICSELDVQGTRFAVALAERIVRLRERTGGAPIEWSAYALPRLEQDELRVLQRAGYVGALNDVLSLDDANLRRAGVPYRSKQAVAFLKAVTELDREEAASAANAATAEGKVRAGLTQRTPKELASVLGLFLGNAHADVQTLRNTLKRIEDEGLRENYRAGLAFPSTRVFEIDGKPMCPTTVRGLHSYGPGGADREVDIVWPTYYYPDFLVERLGGPDAVIEFMRFVGDTLMSVGHRSRKDWAWFLSHNTTVEAFARLVASAGAPPVSASPIAREVMHDRTRLRTLFAPPASAKGQWNHAAAELFDHVWAGVPDVVQRVCDVLGVRPEWSEYRILEQMSRKYASREAVLSDVDQNETSQLYVNWLLYAKNVVLRPDYRALLFD